MARGDVKKTKSQLPGKAKDPLAGEVALRAKFDKTGLTIAGRSRALAAADQLLGGLIGVPAGYFEGLRRRNELRRVAKESFLEADIAAAMQQVEGLSDLGQATMQRLLADEYRKQKNRASVWAAAEEQLLLSSGGSSKNVEEDSGEKGGTLNPDWMNKFCNFAQDISKEDVQVIWGKILAGEISRPGSFSLSTLRVISELDQEIASDFNLAWTKDVGGAVNYSAEWQRGEWFARWKRLSEVGLMAESSIRQFLPVPRLASDEYGLWCPVEVDGNYLNIVFRRGANVTWDSIEFTRVGREIGKLSEKPNYEVNFRTLANHISKSGLVSISLTTDKMRSEGRLSEVIWKAPE